MLNSNVQRNIDLLLDRKRINSRFAIANICFLFETIVSMVAMN